MNASAGGGLVLGIELSQREGGVALVDGSGASRVRAVSGGRRDRDELMPAIRGVLEELERSARELDLIVVDIGPGGFTGLRISIAAAQAIAEVSGASVMGIPGADVAMATSIGLGRRKDIGAEVAVVSAVRDESGWESRFVWDEAARGWRISGQPGLRSVAPSGVGAVVADEHLPEAWRDSLRAEGVTVVEPRFDPARLADLGREACESGIEGRWGWIQTKDPAKLVPLYPRVPEAVRLWQERTAR